MATQTSIDLSSAWLSTLRLSHTELERYYLGDHPARLFTQQQVNNPEFSRFFAPINYCKTIIDEPIGYLANCQVNITSKDTVLQDFLNAYYRNRIKPVVPALVKDMGLFGEVYAYLYPDVTGQHKGVKIRSIAPIEAGAERLEASFAENDETELIAAIIHYSIIEPGKEVVTQFKISMDTEEIVVEKKAGQTAMWKEVSREDNFLEGTIPLVPLFNPSGISDILPVISVQDDMNKLMFDIRVVREHHGFPVLFTESDIPHEVKIAPGRMFGNVKNPTRLDSASIAPLLEQHRMLVEMFSTLGVSLSLADRNGGNLSGVALRFLQQQFEAKLIAKASELATTYKRILKIACKYIARDSELYNAEINQAGVKVPVPRSVLQSDFQFDVSVEPTIPADQKQQTERAIMLYKAGLVDSLTAMNIANVPDSENVRDELLKETNSTDITITMDKVRLALELGVDKKVLARELGYTDEQLTGDNDEEEPVVDPTRPFTEQPDSGYETVENEDSDEVETLDDDERRDS